MELPPVQKPLHTICQAVESNSSALNFIFMKNIMALFSCIIQNASSGCPLTFKYHPHNILPMISLLPSIDSLNFCEDTFIPSESILSIRATIMDQWNQNLSVPQKELLLTHCKLSHARMGWCQHLFVSAKSDLPPILSSKYKLTSSCQHFFVLLTNFIKLRLRDLYE